MSEADAIKNEQALPHTVASLATDLRRLGVRPGMVLLVHSSLKAIGWVCGGAQAVVLALEEALGRFGTLVMPTHSSGLSEPSAWREPPVPEAWWPAIRDAMPAFDPDLTPTREMGAIPETFRKQRGVLRSRHPAASFAAWGKRRRKIIGRLKLDFSMDLDSPLGRVYKLEGSVLLLGVGHDKNTSLHLAEYLTDFRGKLIIDCSGPVFRRGRREWVTSRDINFGGADFPAIGAAFEAEGRCSIGLIGAARSVLFRQRDLVDFASAWMKQNR